MKPFDELIDFMVDNIPPHKVLAFQASQSSHNYVYELIEKEKTGYILDTERKELDQFGEVEHIIRLAKIKANQEKKYDYNRTNINTMAFSTVKELGDVLLEHQIRYQTEDFTFLNYLKAPDTLSEEINFIIREFAFRGSEAAVCESLLFPILKTAWKPYVQKLTLWSHRPVYDPTGLLGIPDYTLTKRSSLGTIIFEDPYLAVIEAKRDDFTGGWGQCTLEMLAFQRLNHRPDLPVYGIVTNGRSWEMGYLQKDMFTLYNKTLFLENLNELMSGLTTIFERCIQNLDSEK